MVPNLSTITFVGARPQDPGGKFCGEGVPCPRFALYIEDLGKPKGPRILLRDAGPATLERRQAAGLRREGPAHALDARKRLVANDQAGEPLPDRRESPGPAAELAARNPNQNDALSRQDALRGALLRPQSPE